MADMDTAIRYYVKDCYADYNKQFEIGACPWHMAATDQGFQFVKWDVAILGTNQPTIAYLDSIDAAAQVWKQNLAQSSKPVELKKAENNFLLLCEQLTGKKEKVGFDTLRTILEAMLTTDPQTAMVLSWKLLSIDAEGKRFDQRWWDSCIWHADV